MNRPFLKMNGTGNDFVVVEARSQPFAPEAARPWTSIGKRDGSLNAG